VSHPLSYEIRIRGWLGRTMLAAFPALHADTQGADTVLADMPDQAALHGVLAQIESLGPELLLVRHLPGGTGRESHSGVTPPHPGAKQAESS
jgi:hypothetical protein